MSTPLLSLYDETAVAAYLSSLPQSLIISAEPGLDGEQLSEQLAAHQPSNIYRVIPEEGKRHISIQQVRDCITSMRTYAARRRVIIIHPADTLTEEAQNALLKMLEEPLKRTHFILLTAKHSLLLPTIISRCQLLVLHRTSSAQDDILLRKSNLDEQSIQQIRFLAAGRPSRIRQLIAMPALLESYRTYVVDARTILTESPYRMLCTVYKYANNREVALEFLDVLATIIKFQITTRGQNQQLHAAIHRLHTAEHALQANGNVKLALLQLIP